METTKRCRIVDLGVGDTKNMAWDAASVEKKYNVGAPHLRTVFLHRHL
jgi:hypothetical protein